MRRNFPTQPPVCRGFNPRTRKGCDLSYWFPKSKGYGFNPRTRKGCDKVDNFTLLEHISFNPRTRKGCDDAIIYNAALVKVSIHAPVKDATENVSNEQS